MNKLLLGLGLLDLTVHFPHIVALVFTGLFIYSQLTDKDKQDIMSLYTNGKEFGKYLTSKAKKLGVSLRELRRQIVIDVEVPETDYAEVFNDAPAQPETPTVAQEFYENFVSKLSPEEQELLQNSDALHDKLASVVRQAYTIDNVIWVEASLNDCLMYDYDPKDKWSFNYRKEIEDWGIIVDWDNPFTEKDFRQLSMKLKALSRNLDGSIKDETLLENTEMTIKAIYDYFTNYQFKDN